MRLRMASYAHCSNSVKSSPNRETCNGYYIFVSVLIITYERKKMLMEFQENQGESGELMAPMGIYGRTGAVNIHRSDVQVDYSFFKEIPEPPCLEAFFSFSISFFCLFDLGAAFCTFFCSLFATISSLFPNVDQ
jgi:hypothetical protein